MYSNRGKILRKGHIYGIKQFTCRSGIQGALAGRDSRNMDSVLPFVRAFVDQDTERTKTVPVTVTRSEHTELNRLVTIREKFIGLKPVEIP